LLVVAAPPGFGREQGPVHELVEESVLALWGGVEGEGGNLAGHGGEISRRDRAAVDPGHDAAPWTTAANHGQKPESQPGPTPAGALGEAEAEPLIIQSGNHLGRTLAQAARASNRILALSIRVSGAPRSRIPISRPDRNSSGRERRERRSWTSSGDSGR